MKPSIFYLDDEAVLLDIFKEMFSDEYEVHTATTISEARRMIAQNGKKPEALTIRSVGQRICIEGHGYETSWESPTVCRLN